MALTLVEAEMEAEEVPDDQMAEVRGATTPEDDAQIETRVETTQAEADQGVVTLEAVEDLHLTTTTIRVNPRTRTTARTKVLNVAHL